MAGEERLAAIEERLRSVERRLEKIEHVLYGNNPEQGIMHRLAVIEERLRSIERVFDEKVKEIQEDIDRKFDEMNAEQRHTKRIVLGTFITVLISIIALLAQMVVR